MEHKVIEYVLYKFDLKEVSMEEIIEEYQSDNLPLIKKLYNGFTGLFKKDICSYALFKNSDNLEMAAEWLIRNNG